MSGKYHLPNSSVPIQSSSGFVNHAWYRYLGQLGTLTAPGGTGLTALDVGYGLSAVKDGSAVTTLTSVGTISLNLDYYGQAPGSLLARGEEAWEGLPPGGEGAVLTSGGPGELPFWGSTQEQALPEAPPVGVLGNTGQAEGPAAGVLLTALLDALFGATWGNVVFRGQTQWEGLAPGASPGLILTTGGVGRDPYWSRLGVATARALGTTELIGGAFVVAPLGFVDSNGNNIVLSDGLTAAS